MPPDSVCRPRDLVYVPQEGFASVRYKRAIEGDGPQRAARDLPPISISEVVAGHYGDFYGLSHGAQLLRGEGLRTLHACSMAFAPCFLC